jgi:hypothetical protein
VSAALLGALLLAVSLVSVVIYMTALGQLLIGAHHRGLVRTAVCRLVAALLYVGVALATLHRNDQGPLIGLGVFTAVQLMWQANSIADVILTRTERRHPMSDPFSYDHGVTDPIASDAPLLSDAVTSAEIDRLSGNQTTMKRHIAGLRTDVDKTNSAWRYGVGALVFSIVVAGLGLIFGLIVFNRADNAQALAQQNAEIIKQQGITQDKLDTTVHQFCGLYGSFIRFYNPKARAVFPQGPDEYDAEFHELLTESNNLQCGLKTPPGLGG